MTGDIVISAAMRTPVAPRGGALSRLPINGLCTPLISAMLGDEPVDMVVLGNALYGGGNPARLVALDCGIVEQVPALTIDTQCCAGMDAVFLAADAIRSGRAHHVLAGGAESFSRAPIRMHRGADANDDPVPYDRPTFTPWPKRDPDMLVAAAALASAHGITRSDQETFAVASHEKARMASTSDAFTAEIVPIEGLKHDEFTRELSLRLCGRLPALAGEDPHAITAATTAVEADAAAFVTLRTTPDAAVPAIRIRDYLSCGADPAMPGLAPIEAARLLLARNDLKPSDLACIEIMEAFAAQAMAFIDAFQFPVSVVNISGGALARGHPIGASGAILVVRLVHELRRMPAGSIGLAAIAGAGGLASCILLERV
jgi:acetyl-CoA C-acetyltransferase